MLCFGEFVFLFFFISHLIFFFLYSMITTLEKKTKQSEKKNIEKESHFETKEDGQEKLVILERKKELVLDRLKKKKKINLKNYDIPSFSEIRSKYMPEDLENIVKIAFKKKEKEKKEKNDMSSPKLKVKQNFSHFFCIHF